MKIIQTFDREEILAFTKSITNFDQGCIEFMVFRSMWSRTGTQIIPGDRYSQTLGGWYDSLAYLIPDILKLKEISGYVTINPVNPVFLAKTKNKLVKIQRGQGASDEHIQCLRWIFLDIDPKKPIPDISATDVERAAALARRDAILVDHPELRPHALWGGSGNGGWILVRLPDLPNDAHHNAMVGRVIDHFHRNFSDGEAEVDSKTRNPARIMGIPGTTKCKGEARAPGRPWRMASFDSLQQGHSDTPDPIDIASWLELHAPLATQEEKQAARNGNGHVQILVPEVPVKVDLHERLFRGSLYIQGIPGAVSGAKPKGGHAQTFDVACALVKGFDISPAHALPLILQWNAKCQPPWEPHELEHKLQDADEKPDDKPRGYLLNARPARHFVDFEDAPVDPLAPAPGGITHDWTDMGNGHRLVDMFGHRFRYCKSYGEWMIYDGTRWSQDQVYAIEAMAKCIPGRIIQEIDPKATDEEKKIAIKFSKQCQSREKIVAAITSARSDPGVPVVPVQLDTNPWLFNCQNGTIDLMTGHFRDHKSSDLITKIAPVVYDPDALCPTWDWFLNDIFSGDAEVIDYVQRAAGYAMTGVIREHILFLLYGTGRNGKSTMLDAMRFVFGDYGAEIDSDLLIAQAFNQHPTGLTELEGRRYIIANETDDGKRLAESLVKKLTGGNSIQARKMHKDFYTFNPSHHIFLAVNYRPDIRNSDPAIWRRIKLIPFLNCYDPEIPNGREPDFTLKDRIDAERSGVLNWMLEGCRKWQKVGLREPQAIREKVTEYKDEQDAIGLYLDERCVIVSGKKIPFIALYEDYADWSDRTGSHKLGIRRFAAVLGDRGFPTKKSNSITYKAGLRLKTPMELSVNTDDDDDSPTYEDYPIDHM